MRGKAKLAAACMAMVIGLLIGVCPAPPAGAMTANGGAINAELAALINHERAAYGLPALPTIDLGAHAWAHHLVVTGTFAHASLTVDAENLASATSNHTTGDMVVMWMNSPGHRTNMLNPNAVAIDVGISCGGGRMVAVARFHQAWAIPTVGGGPRAVAPGSGASCAALGLA
jgi:hypothetical protein